MSWLGVAVAIAAVVAVFVVLARALRKARHYESWGVGELSQRNGPLPHNQGPPIEVVTGPEQVVTGPEAEERVAASTGGAARTAD